MIFYSCVIVLATVASAPVDNYLTMGTDGGSTLCDIFQGDCPFSSNNDDTINSANFNQASAFPGDAGAEKVSALIAAAKSGSSEEDGFFTQSEFIPNQIEPWAVKIAGNLQSQGTDSTRPSPTYDCQKPPDRGDSSLFDVSTVDGTYGSPVNNNPSEERKLPTKDIPCQKCEGSDCEAMVAQCSDTRNPYQCRLCDPHYERPCENIADISRLPSKDNPYGQPWCGSKECNGWHSCAFGLPPPCISL